VGGELLGAPLGGRWPDALRDGGVFGAAGLVYLVLFAIVGAVATFGFVRARRQLAATGAAPSGVGRGSRASGPDATATGPEVPGMAALTKALPLLSFATLFTVAAVPLAAALYVVTSTTWSAVERAVLHREVPAVDRPATAG
jgi:YidC/Oxa1 family membrane protein insertase